MFPHIFHFSFWVFSITYKKVVILKIPRDLKTKKGDLIDTSGEIMWGIASSSLYYSTGTAAWAYQMPSPRGGTRKSNEHPSLAQTWRLWPKVMSMIVTYRGVNCLGLFTTCLQLENFIVSRMVWNRKMSQPTDQSC